MGSLATRDVRGAGATAGRRSLRRNDPVRVGVLLSHTGPLASAERWHLAGTLLGIAEVNDEGGVNGRPLVPIVVDPASDLDAYRRLAAGLLAEEGVSSVFGCCSSDIRKTLVPLFERRGALLWYPTQFEGFEYSPNVIYGGGCPNQHTLPLVDYLFAEGRRSFYLIGTDYVFPRQSNRIFRDQVEARGGEVLGEVYLDRNAAQGAYQAALERMPAQTEAIFSTVVGIGIERLLGACRAARIDFRRQPVASFCATEGDMTEPDSTVGMIASLPYFDSFDGIDNARFQRRLRQRMGSRTRANWLMVASYMQVKAFARAAEAEGSDAAEAVAVALASAQPEGPVGNYTIDEATHYAFARPHIGVANRHGSFDTVQAAARPIAPDPFLLGYA